MAQCSQVWDPADLSFELVDDLTSDPVITLRVETPNGSLRFMAEPEMNGSTLTLPGLRERLRLTREQFAARHGLEVETVRNWETGRREPDTTARSYLRAISNNPEQVERAYAPTSAL